MFKENSLRFHSDASKKKLGGRNIGIYQMYLAMVSGASS